MYILTVDEEFYWIVVDFFLHCRLFFFFSYKKKMQNDFYSGLPTRTKNNCFGSYIHTRSTKLYGKLYLVSSTLI